MINDTMIKSREAYEEYILKMEDIREKDAVKQAQEIASLKRENYQLSIEIYELKENLRVEKEKKEFFNDFLEKVWREKTIIDN